MKKFFDKQSFILADQDASQKKQSLILSLMVILFFILSSITFFDALYAFSDIVGCIVSGSPDVAIKDLLRSLPLILTFFMALWAVLALQACFRNVSDERRRKSLTKDSICLMAFGGVTLLYVIVGRIAGIYESLVEGAPSALYPLDRMGIAILFIAFGVLGFLYPRKIEPKMAYSALPRGPIVTKARGLYCTFVTFWTLISLFGLTAGFMSLFIYDFVHGYAFYGIMVVLVYLLSPIQMSIWEFYYNELKEEKKKEFLLPLSLVSLGVSVLFAALYMVALTTNMDAPSNAGFGMFPVAFAASVNIATLLVVFTPVIVSVVALIKGILAKRK